KNELKVAVLDGFLYITDLQVAGKKRMDIKSFLNGYQIESTAIFV
ncbi:MAG: methionyl-tRNA formyltransferase, partial [Bacteroidetes bacterium]|nr:methionyl-tRNA formyltransferase [Bacteroidota bacterium]